MLFPLSFYTYLLCPLLMGTDIWQEIEVLNQEFVRLGISQSVDYEKYYLYSLITHSTAIEGSTLTELDTQLLFDEGVTAKGKPLVYHLMNEDLKKAYELAKEESAQNAEITPVFLQKLNAALMRTTGSVYNVMGGSFDSSKGSQQISQSDFEFFDLIVGMDESNVEDLLQVSAGRYDDKIKLFRPGGVPDPWYTGDFEETYNLVTAACQDWLQWIRDRQ